MCGVRRHRGTEPVNFLRESRCRQGEQEGGQQLQQAFHRPEILQFQSGVTSMAQETALDRCLISAEMLCRP